MQLQITHRTRYRYSEPVSENYNEVRLQPVSDGTQECHRFELSTTPATRIERYHDFHLNRVDHFYLADPHKALDIEARSEVTTYPPASGANKVRFPLDQLGTCLRMEQCYDFLQRSEFVALDVEIWRFAQDITVGADDAWQAMLAAMGHIHREFRYESGATNVNTRTHEVLLQRRGVCQDFAHLMLGVCRSKGVPARYVSGYLYVAEQGTLRGDLASHAWLELFLPGFGWLGLDPTNNQETDDRYVKVAVGRDYADAAPVRGNFKGRAEQEMTVELNIVRLENPGPSETPQADPAEL